MCESVSCTEVHLLHIEMYCWKMILVIERSYTGALILYTAAIAALKLNLVLIIFLCM